MTGPGATRGKPMDTNAFLTEAEKIKDIIKNMNDAVEAVERLQQKELSSSGNSSTEISDQLDELNYETNQIANLVREKLKDLENHIKGNKNEEVMRRTQTTNLANKFMKVLSRYQKAQVAHRKAHKERMERQYKIVNPSASSRQMKKDLSAADSSDIFAQSLRQNGNEKEAQSALREVQDRHDQIVKLAQSIEELQQLFMDMQSMVASQDQVVIHIENQVQETQKVTEKSVEEVKEAVRQKALSQKKCLYLTIGIIVILLIATLAVYFAHFHPLVMQAAEQEIAKNNTEPAPAQ